MTAPNTNYSQAYLQAEAFTKIHEGGWYAGNLPGDPNPTMHGIIQINYDGYRDAKGLPRQSVQLISEDETEEIYYTYWTGAKCPSIETFSQKLAIVHFDTSFNSGFVRAAKVLQSSVGAAGDGIIGSQTLALVQQKIEADEMGTVTTYLVTRLSFLKGLSNWSSWGHVWTNRLHDLSVIVGSQWRP